MKKRTKICLVATTVLILVGGMIFAYAQHVRIDHEKKPSSRYETNQYEIGEHFSNISLETNVADLVFILSDDGKCSVECYEESDEKHSVSVENDTLTIKVNSKKTWDDYAELQAGVPQITILLPKSEYASLSIVKSAGNIDLPAEFLFGKIDVSLDVGNVEVLSSSTGPIKVTTTTGSISLKDITAESLDLSSTTGALTISNVICKGDVDFNTSIGKANLSDLKCRNFTSTGKTGEISLERVIAEEAFTLKRVTGSVRFKESDASEIYVETTTGKVTGDLLTDKVFVTHTDTGKIDLPESSTGGKCEISTSTGSIKIAVSR